VFRRVTVGKARTLHRFYNPLKKMSDTVGVASFVVALTSYVLYRYQDYLAVAGLSAAGSTAVLAVPCHHHHILSCAALCGTTQAAFLLTALRPDALLSFLTLLSYIVSSTCVARALITALKVPAALPSSPPSPPCECSICLEAMTTDVKALPCAHLYHTRCIDRWLEEQRVCPLCMSPV
jgi:TRAP-type mannitol/chloroaromatic compound transport system permease large subunit